MYKENLPHCSCRKKIDASKIDNEQEKKGKNTNNSEDNGSAPFKNIFRRNRVNTGDSASAFQVEPMKLANKVKATSSQSAPIVKEEIDLVRLCRHPKLVVEACRLRLQ